MGARKHSEISYGRCYVHSQGPVYVLNPDDPGTHVLVDTIRDKETAAASSQQRSQTVRTTVRECLLNTSAFDWRGDTLSNLRIIARSGPRAF
jgi:hypothetical protein